VKSGESGIPYKSLSERFNSL